MDKSIENLNNVIEQRQEMIDNILFKKNIKSNKYDSEEKKLSSFSFVKLKNLYNKYN